MTWVIPAAAHVTLFFPVGGGSFMVGETVKIEWGLDISHGPSNWDLHYSPDGGATWQVIQLNISEFSFSHDWVIPSGISQARIRVVQDNATGTDYQSIGSDFSIQGLATSVDEPGVAPESIEIVSSYPNPFQSMSVLEYSVAQAGHVTIDVYNLLGVKVAVLLDEQLPAGIHEIAWNAADQADGVYLWRISQGSHVQTRTALLLK